VPHTSRSHESINNEIEYFVSTGDHAILQRRPLDSAEMITEYQTHYRQPADRVTPNRCEPHRMNTATLPNTEYFSHQTHQPRFTEYQMNTEHHVRCASPRSTLAWRQKSFNGHIIAIRAQRISSYFLKASLATRSHHHRFDGNNFTTFVEISVQQTDVRHT